MLSRRGFLAAGAAALAAPSDPRSAVAKSATEVSRSFRLKEAAGLRRFGYPVFTRLPAELSGPKLRLERGGHAVPAQFRTVDFGEERSIVALDFNASPGPLETEIYTVKSGREVEPGPEPGEGMRAQRLMHKVKDEPASVWAVTNGSSLRYKLDEHLTGFLRSVSNAGLEFIAPGGPCFRALDTHFTAKPLIHLGESSGNDPANAAERFSSKIVRAGPLAVSLRFEGVVSLRGARLPMVVDTTFPSSKSWVEVSWAVEDRAGAVAGIELSMRLKVESVPVLVDLGANNTVYGQLKAGETLELVGSDASALRTGGAPWTVMKRSKQKKEIFARAVTAHSAPAEGWAHFMDKSRCTAVAVAEFGRSTEDAIICGGDGSVGITRRYATRGIDPPKGPKSLRFWLHFVSNPVQIGALTSPQAVLSPLAVEWV
jgi:hypothetical protein